MKYSLDTSALLDGSSRHYPRDIFKDLWSRIETLIEAGHIRISEEVLNDLKKKNDEIYKWAKNQDGLVVPIDRKIQVEVSSILGTHERLIDTRRNRSGSDPFVIALARIHKCAVVSGEVNSNSLIRPHIPDVCDALGVPHMNLLGLIRKEKWRFGGG